MLKSRYVDGVPQPLRAVARFAQMATALALHGFRALLRSNRGNAKGTRASSADVRLVPSVVVVWVVTASAIALGQHVVVYVSLVIVLLLATLCARYGLFGARGVVALNGYGGQLVLCLVLMGLSLVAVAASPLRGNAALDSARASHSTVTAVFVFDEAVSASALQLGPVIEVPGSLRGLSGPDLNQPAQAFSVPVPVTVALSAVSIRPSGAGTVVTGYFSVVPKPGTRTAARLTSKSDPSIVHHVPLGGLEQARSTFLYSASKGNRFAASFGFVSKDALGLLQGMVIGERGGLSEELASDMRTSGLTHLTAVSGSNCMIVLLGVTVLGRRLRLHRHVVSLAAGLSLAAFVALVGPDSSVLRAAVMAYLAIVAYVRGRGSRAMNALYWCIITLLLWQPWLGLDLGFALSVLATFGLLSFGRPLAEALSRRIPNWLANSLSVPFAAGLFCAPLIAMVQGKLTPFSLLANAVAAPAVPVITVLGISAVLASALSPPIAEALTVTAAIPCEGIVRLAHSVAQFPGASLSIAQGWLGFSVAVATSLVLLAVTLGVMHRATLRPLWLCSVRAFSVWLLSARMNLALVLCFASAVWGGAVYLMARALLFRLSLLT